MSDKTADQAKGFYVASVVPFLKWVRSYDRAQWLRADVMAGVTVAAFSVPESMAYADLAGLTPEHGLYASMLALLVYMIFGTSNQMSVGTTSALSIMVPGTLGTLALNGPDEYLAAAQMTAVIAGGLAIVAGLFKLGFIVNFISESVLKGFSAGAALYIASSQLSKLFGIEGVQGNFFTRIRNVLTNLDETNGWTLALGLASMALLLGLDRFKSLPGSLIVVLLAIAVMSFSDLEERGVSVAGEFASGLPSLGISDLPSGQFAALFGLAAGCFLLSYVEGIGVAKTFAASHKERVDADQELYANGAINLASGLASGLPVGGSMSRSAVNDEAGAKTPLAGGVAALLLALVLLFLTGLFAELPEATLAAVVLIAVRGLIDIPALKRIFNLSKGEFAAAMLTMAGVLTFGMLEGIVIGAGFSLLLLAYRASQPKVDVLGRVPGSDVYSSIENHPEFEQEAGSMVLRVDGGIFYANADAVKDRIAELLSESDPPITDLIIDLENVPGLDIAALDMMAALQGEAEEQGIKLTLVGATETVRSTLEKAGLGNLNFSQDAHSVVSEAVKD